MIKSYQERTQDGKKKDENNPINLKANKSNQPGSQQGFRQRLGSTSAKSVTNTSVEDKKEEETTDAVTSEETEKQNHTRKNL